MSYPPRRSDEEAGPSRTRSPFLRADDSLEEQQRLQGDEDQVDELGDMPPAAELSRIQRYEDFSTVDWVQDSLRERYSRVIDPPDPRSFKGRLSRLEGPIGYCGRAIVNILEEGETWVVISLVGVAIGMTMALISITSVWLSDIKMGYCTTGWWLSRKFCCLEVSDEGELCDEWRPWGGMQPFEYVAYILYAALFSFSAANLVRAFAPYAAGSGISEIKCILGGFIIKGFLSFATTAIKAVTLPLTIASGLSVGKEGPSVHYACGIGHVVGELFQRYRRSASKMRDIVTSASAAGVAVAFGSPIGGVLFSIEEMNQGFSVRTMWQSFVCALVATFTLASMDPFRTGKLVLFQVSYDRDWHYFEIPAYLLIGIFGGLYGVFVIKFNLQVVSFRKKNLKDHAVSEAVVLASITAVIGYLNRFLRIDMTECMEMLFRECEGGGDRDGLCQTSEQWKMVNSLLLGVLVRTALVIVSYGCKVPCGIFVPSMAVGAMFGRMIGILMKALHSAVPDAPWFAVCPVDAPCITPGTYAFLGAAACLSGVTRLTVTVVVIMFELTGALTYILPVMIVLLVTKAVGDSFGAHGIADTMIKFNGFPFLEKEDKESGDPSIIEPIGNVMERSVVMMRADGMPLQAIEEIIQSTAYQGFPVVRGEFDKTIVGMVSKTELRYAMEKARRTRMISETATCTFHCLPSDEQPSTADGLLPRPDIVIPATAGVGRASAGAGGRSPGLGGGPGQRDGSLPRRVSGALAEVVDFGQYVDETPITVSPKMPLEIVMQLFRRLGPRVILVASEGLLVGLVTVKDVLRHEAHLEHEHERRVLSPGGAGVGSLPLSASARGGAGGVPLQLSSPARGKGKGRAGAGAGVGEDGEDRAERGWTEWDAGDAAPGTGTAADAHGGAQQHPQVQGQGEAPQEAKGLEIALEEGLRWASHRAGGFRRMLDRAGATVTASTAAGAGAGTAGAAGGADMGRGGGATRSRGDATREAEEFELELDDMEDGWGTGGRAEEEGAASRGARVA